MSPPNTTPLLAPAPHLYWYITGGVLCLLTLRNLALKVAERCKVEPVSPHAMTGNESTGSTPSLTSFTWSRRHEQLFIDLPMADRILPAHKRLAKTLYTMWKKYFALVALPVAFGQQHLVTWYLPEFIWAGGYIAGVLVLSLYGTSWDPSIWANQAGMVAVAQVPFFMALSGKNNLISFLTGYPSDRLTFLQRWTGRVILAGIWVHTAGHIYLAREKHHFHWESQTARWGMVAAVSTSLLVLVGLRPVRRYLYEFFVAAHVVLGIVTVVAFILHWNAVAVWIYPGLGLAVIDVLIRLTRFVITNRLWSRQHRPAHLSSVTPSTLVLSVPAPSFTWKAGQHFYLNMPSISLLPWETHPFTPASLPNAYEDGELTFIIRVRNGFTRRLRDKLDDVRKLRGLRSLEACEIEINANVEGSYGVVADLNKYDSVVLVAGGAGISFALSQLLAIVTEAKAGRGHVRMVRLVWMVRSPEHVAWIAPMLAASLLDLPPTLKISLHVHITTPAVPTSPDQLDLDELYWSHHVPLRTPSTRRSRNPLRRMLSAASWASWTKSSPQVTWNSSASSNVTLVSPERVKTRSKTIDIEKISPPFQPTKEDLEMGFAGLPGDHPFISNLKRDLAFLSPSSYSLPAPVTSSSARRPSPPPFHSTDDLTPTPLALTLDSWAARHLPAHTRSSSTGSSTSAASFYSVATHLTPPPRMGSPKPQLPPILSPFVVWHEGRANLDEALADTLASMGLGCRLAVSACGPGALLDASRAATRRAMAVGGAWRGEVDIDFHQESFGF